jgi:radical SAM superfamily enzyme
MFGPDNYDHESYKNNPEEVIEQDPPAVIKSELSEESKISELNEKIDLVTKWLGFTEVRYELAYRGTQHGFTIPAWFR